MDSIEFQIFRFVALIFSVIIHEIAHAWTALKCGDSTARDMGRITLNPVPHIDPVMTIVIPALLVFTGSPVIFGGARPVPVNFRRCYNPRRAYWLVSIAGPLSNLAQAAVALLAAFAISFLAREQALLANGMILNYFTNHNFTIEGIGIAGYAVAALFIYGLLNIFLMIFNLIPIPPLDGSRVLTVLLPDKIAWRYAQIERYGFFIIFGLLYLRVFNGLFHFVFTNYITVFQYTTIFQP